MSEQPQQWTWETVSNMYHEKEGNFFDRVANAHNAVLVAEREKRMTAGEFGRHLTELSAKYEKQLAAARQEGIDWADKQYYGVSGYHRIRELEQQLAAERKRLDWMLSLLADGGWTYTFRKLRTPTREAIDEEMKRA